MQPVNELRGGYENTTYYWGETYLHPAAAVLIFASTLAILFFPRRYLAGVPILVLVGVTEAQHIQIWDLNLAPVRLLCLAFVARLVARGEWRRVKWCRLDLLYLLVFPLPPALAVLRGSGYLAAQNAALGFDASVSYVFGRIALAGESDWKRFFGAAAFVGVPVAILFVYEALTAHNLFSVFGGVAETTRVRDGKLRAQGAFAHPILAGVWFVTLLPLCLVFVRRSGAILSVASVLLVGSMVAVVYAVDSSTPVAGILACALLAAAYPWRAYFKNWRLAVVLLLIVHFVSKSGLHGLLFTRVTLVSGSTGFHRYRLYEAAGQNFWGWAVLGLDSTAAWGWHLFDCTSEYLVNGIRGGVWLIIAHIAFYVGIFRRLGLRFVRRDSQAGFYYAVFLVVAIQCFQYLGVSYFGQIVMLAGTVAGGAATLATARQVGSDLNGHSKMLAGGRAN